MAVTDSVWYQAKQPQVSGAVAFSVNLLRPRSRN